MSKTMVEKMLKEALNSIDDKSIRKGVDSNRQRVRVTRQGLKRAFQDGYERSRGEGSPDLEEQVFFDAATAAITALKKHIERPRTNATYTIGKKSTVANVYFDQSRFIKKPFKVLKDTGFNYIVNILKARGGSREQVDGVVFKSETQRLHRSNTTVGVARFAALMNTLVETENFSGFINSVEYRSFREEYPGLIVRYKMGGDLKGFVTIDVDSRTKNTKKETTDFSKIRPILETKLQEYVIRKGFADQEGSKTPRQKKTEEAEYKVVVGILSKAKNAKLVGKLKKPKKTETDFSIRDTARQARSVVASSKKARKRKRNPASRNNAQQLLALQNILQKKIQTTVRKNMKTPGLVNRTGRFSNSVRITDISTTPKGFPSIGYTYDKNPYQIFEQGAGKAPWATNDRDPRKVIDKSIREIASEVLIGRFFTRRV